MGDLLVENPTVGDVTMLGHPITGASEGVLLAVAAALGVVVSLPVASAGTARPRRARRKQLRAAARELHGRMAELERENARLRAKLARDQRVRRLGERADPAEFGSTPWTGSAAGRGITVPSTECHPEPLYEEAKRAARLRSNPDHVPRYADERSRRS